LPCSSPASRLSSCPSGPGDPSAFRMPSASFPAWCSSWPFPSSEPWSLRSVPRTHRLDLPGRRHVLVEHLPGRCARLLRACQDRYDNVFGNLRRALPGGLGAARWAAGNLHDPAVPGREASIEEVAPVCVVLRGRNGPDLRRLRSRSRDCGEPPGGAQSLRVGEIPLVRDRGYVSRLAASRVYPGFGAQPGVTLPSFRQGGA
jgi:hypothetical protein